MTAFELVIVNPGHVLRTLLIVPLAQQHFKVLVPWMVIYWPALENFSSFL